MSTKGTCRIRRKSGGRRGSIGVIVKESAAICGKEGRKEKNISTCTERGDPLRKKKKMGKEPGGEEEEGEHSWKARRPRKTLPVCSASLLWPATGEK